MRGPEFLAAVVCSGFGLVLALLPHLIWWFKQGSPNWIASNDELVCYYPVASQAYFNHPWYLSDSTFVTGGATMYPWLQFVPAIGLAKCFGLGPLGIGLVWRAWAGISMALGLYLLFLKFLKRPWVAALLSVMLISDAGMAWGRPALNQAIIFVQMWQANPPAWFFNGHPVLLLHWRLITPGVSLFFLLLHLWLTAKTREEPNWKSIALAGASFGLLFYVYFYFWTAAGLALVLALALDAGRRRVYFHAGWIGGLIGLPALIQGMLLKQATGLDWLQRLELFIPIPRWSEFSFSKLGALMLVASLVWVLVRRKELIHLWALPAAGFLLRNEQILTGIQMDNGHYGYVWGLGLSILFGLLAAETLLPAVSRSPWTQRGILALCGLHILTGVGFRALEATRSQQMLEIQNHLARYREQRRAASVPPLAPNAVVAGAAEFVDFAVVLENVRPLERTAFLSANIRNAEWDARVALNSFLEGRDRAAFAVEQEMFFNQVVTGPWVRDPAKKSERLASRHAAFDAVIANPNEAMNHFGVRYVALPVGGTRPAYLASRWRPLQTGPHWEVWERVVRSTP